MIIRITNFCLLCLLLLAAVPLGAQGWDRTYKIWKNHYSSIRTVATSDGHLVSLIANPDIWEKQNFYLGKLNANGVPVLTKEFTFSFPVIGVDLQQAPNGDWVVLYFSPEGFRLMRLNADFEIVWNEPISTGVQELLDAIAFGNDAIFVSGTRGLGALELQHVVYRISNDGAQVTSNVGPLQNSTGASIKPLSSGKLIAAGASEIQGGNFSGVLSKINPTGEFQQQQFLPTSTRSNGFTIDASDDIVISGVKESQGFCMKLDSNFNTIWDRTYPQYAGVFDVSIIPNGGGYWALAYHNIPKFYYSLIRLDEEGNVLLEKPLKDFVYLNRNWDGALYSLPDGGVLISGFTNLPIPFDQRRTPRILRTDGQGNTLTSALSGRIWRDNNDNCIQDENVPLPDRAVIATDADGFEWSSFTDTLGQFFIPLMPGAYTVAFKTNTGGWVACQDTFQVNVPANDTLDNVQFLSKFAPAPLDSVCGVAYQDLDGDCQKDAFEPGYANLPVRIQFIHPINGDTILETTTDAQGYFCLPDLSVVDNSTVGNLTDPNSVTANGETCFRQCVDNFTFNFADSNSVFISIGLRCQESPNCPVMETDVFVTGIRPCLPSGYCYVSYYNSGTATADSASITVSVDTALLVTGASLPWTSRVGNVFTYQLGQVQGGQSGNFSLFVEAPCDDPAGTTYCVEARAYPDTLCQVNTENWDGSEIKVEAECLGDSVQFRIRNIGTGDMQQALEYIVIEDNVLLMSSPGSFQLSAGATTIIMLPATGAFYRLEATQSSGYPGLSDPVAWVEGCAPNGSTVSLGFVNQYELPDEEPWLDIFCAESINSYDPNDKNGFPRGYGEEFFIEPDTDLEYVIRFQNTGNAPAINVEIRDTLPAGVLDPTTVRPGASSHPYTFDIQGNGVLVFRFPLIMLPDSFSDLEGSQGFVKFRVSQQPDLPLGTKIRNDAAIYFDFNAPIITNRTLHTLSRDFIALKDMTPLRPDIEIKASPNPTNGLTTVKVKGVEPETRLRFQLWSLSGRLLRTENFFGAQYSLDMSDLPEGLYLFSIEDENGKIASGKLVKYRP